MIGQIRSEVHSFLTLYRMDSKPMRCAADAAKKAAARMNAAASSSSQVHSTDDMSSVGQSPQPAALVAAGACGDAPHAYDGSPVELIYSGESDCGSDSKRTARSPVSQKAAEYEPSSKKARSNIRTHDSYHSLFDAEDEKESSSSALALSHSPVRECDDGPRHRETVYRDTPTSVGITQEALDRNVLRLASEPKPWLLPERLINSLSGDTSAHHRIPLFDAKRLHGLDISASNFRAEEDFYLDAFLKHRWYSGNTKRDKNSLLQAWNAFIHNVESIGREA